MNGKLLTLALGVLLTQGEPALRAALTVPRPWVEKSCKQLGTNVAESLEERDEAAEAFTQFVVALASGLTKDHPEAAAAREELGITKINSTPKAVSGSIGNIISVALIFYRAFDADTVRRMLTVPKSAIVQVCHATGGDPGEVMHSRDHATEELLEFLESLVDANFTDPD